MDARVPIWMRMLRWYALHALSEGAYAYVEKKHLGNFPSLGMKNDPEYISLSAQPGYGYLPILASAGHQAQMNWLTYPGFWMCMNLSVYH